MRRGAPSPGIVSPGSDTRRDRVPHAPLTLRHYHPAMRTRTLLSTLLGLGGLLGPDLNAQASASEIVAGAVQVARRGFVIGDRSAGAVMESRCYRLSAGSVIALLYTLCVTIDDLVLTDGTRLEKRGVIPDETVLPSGADIAARRDPVLARALTRLGRPTDPIEAGRLLPPRDEDLLW